MFRPTDSAVISDGDGAVLYAKSLTPTWKRPDGLKCMAAGRAAGCAKETGLLVASM